jgi:Tol biopolymer transport system component
MRQLVLISAVTICALGTGCRDAVAPDENVGAPELSSAPPPLEPIGPVLAFQRSQNGSSDIFRIAASGKFLMQLTSSSAADSQPAWSPDGKKLAWVQAANGTSQIWVMNPDGSGKTNLSNSKSRDRLPVWSPDGSKILFERRVTNLLLKTYWDIYVMNADGSGQLNLSNHAANDQHARWSPSGTDVVFTSQRDGNRELYRVNTKGSGLVRLTYNSLDDDNADWSPNGQKIAFDRFPNGSHPLYGSVYTMNADGSAVSLLNSQLYYAYNPRWSPSGSTLLLLAEGGWDVIVVNADGSNPLELEVDGSSGGPGDAVWSPDGSRIAYSNWEPFDNGNDDAYGIRTVSPDGTGKQIVTNHPGNSGIIWDQWPAWKP